MRHGKNREKNTIQVNILNYNNIYKIPKVFDLTTRAVQVICSAMGVGCIILWAISTGGGGV